MTDSESGGNNPIAGGGLKTSKLFWLSIVGPLVVIAAVAAFLFIRSDDEPAQQGSRTPAGQASSTYTESVTEQWNAIRTVCAELVKKEQGVIDQATLADFSSSVNVTAKRVAGARKEIETIDPVPSEYRDRHRQLTGSIIILEDYLARLQGLTAKPAAGVTQEEFKPVDTAGVDAKKKTDLAVDEMGFLERLPQITFTLQTDLLTYYQSIWAGGATASRTPGRQPSQTPASGQTSASGAPGPEDAINYFGSYFVSGDEYGMSQIMIGQAASDFAAQSSGVYPFMHEILEGPVIQDGNYIYRVMYSFRIDTGPYLEDWTMVVSLQGSAYYITGANLELRTEYTDN